MSRSGFLAMLRNRAAPLDSANIVFNIITEFAQEYRTVLDGNNHDLSSVELSGGSGVQRCQRK